MRTFFLPMTAGERLFIWRLRNNMSIITMAKKVGYSRETFSDMEHGRVDPAPEYRSRIEEITGGRIKAPEWAYQVEQELLPNEYLIITLRRKKITQAAFCAETGIHTTRLNRIINARIQPSDREQTAIGRKIIRLKRAWRP